ncbi:hypothetical protein GMDG_06315 [Pseudogymnoascus destructans 20631-21]|uniref:FAD-binding PCMH-type domain-containing protein n=1 Tax=Pseudogymnoascus destructans (strain ATCC MYA-4855 / 20631-21) TaxID=658429 RepID=L8FS39_PSED2|nr:hypothetical protein GMDG_06315 [Pseudogymnoascus destructans 20631-21]
MHLNLLYLYLLAASLGLAVAQPNLTALYAPGLSAGSEIFYPTDSDYSEVTPRWNLYDAPTYFGAIKPATEADVQHIVKVSAQNNISFLATGRGHGSTGTLAALNGIEIDLSHFRTVDLDAENNKLTVGGAVNFSQLFDPLYNAGKMLPFGNSRCVGLLGASLGGTIGVMQGILGLGVDYLDSVRMVTSNGEIVEASKTKHADLFWGMRGAGANFGIVTSATFHLHDLLNSGDLTSIDLLYPGSANATIYEALKTYDDDIPNELTINVASTYNQTSGQSAVIVNLVWFGPEADVTQHIQPFIVAGPTTTNTKTVRWTDWYTVALFGAYVSPGATDCTYGQYYNAYTLGIAQTDPVAMTALFNNITAFSSENPDFTGFFGVNRYPNAVALSVEDNDTAYPYRGVKSQITIQSNYHPNATLNDAANHFFKDARAVMQETSGLDCLSIYVNFAHGDEGPEAWYSHRKLARLSRLKRKWDPSNRFGFYQPVPLHYHRA